MVASAATDTGLSGLRIRHMARPKRIDDGEVLMRARELFERHGYAVSTREIATVVGLSQPALYQRFGNKGALFIASMGLLPLDVDAVLRHDPQEVALSLDSQLAGLIGRLESAVANVLPAMLHTNAAHKLEPEMANALHRHLGAETLVRKLHARVKEWKTSGLIAVHVDPIALVNMLLSLVHGRVLIRIAGAAVDHAKDEHERRTIAVMLCRGVATQG